MATEPHLPGPGSQPGNHADGAVKWLLGALGFLWLGGLAVRTLRGEKRASAGGSGVPLGDVNRLGTHSRWAVMRLPKPSRGHETRDANARWILAVILFLLVFGLSLHAILAWFLSALKQGTTPTDRWRPVQPAVQQAARASFPVLQVSAPLDLQAFRAGEDAELGSYGWINKTSGVVRIPIERAMELVLQQGLPTRGSNGENQVGPSTWQLMQQRPQHRQPEIQGKP